MEVKYLFTITAGRSGSAWLADFLKVNLSKNIIHESLGISDFGRSMPDIRIMRMFNNFGNNQEVQHFWNHKLSLIDTSFYGETNHTLGKCGLIENLSKKISFQKKSLIIILRRNLIKQTVSYLHRNDFGNITLAWQWYLHPSYRKKIVNPEPFLNMGALGIPIWYSIEMDVRQHFYKLKYKTVLNFIDVDLEQITKLEGAKAILSSIRETDTCIMPEAANTSSVRPPQQLTDRVEEIFSKLNFNSEDLALAALKDGFSFEI